MKVVRTSNNSNMSSEQAKRENERGREFLSLEPSEKLNTQPKVDVCFFGTQVLFIHSTIRSVHVFAFHVLRLKSATVPNIGPALKMKTIKEFKRQFS